MDIAPLLLGEEDSKMRWTWFASRPMRKEEPPYPCGETVSFLSFIIFSFGCVRPVCNLLFALFV